MTDTWMSKDEQQVAGTVRSYFASFVDNTYLNEQDASKSGFDGARWAQMVELGWSGMHLPETVGGAGGTLTDAAIVAREYGRAAFASPLLQTLRAGVVLAALNEGQRFDIALGRIASGAVFTVLAPPDGELVARRTTNRGEYVLVGRPTLVEWLTAAEGVVLVVPLEDHGWLVGVVDAADLVAVGTEVGTFDNERAVRVELDGFTLAVADVAEVTSDEAGLALARANLLRASAMVGGCEDVVERTARYATERWQFGQPLGAFQAVRHHLARMLIASDAARLLCDDSLSTIDESGAEVVGLCSAAVFGSGRSYVEIVLTAAQLHGGVGTTTEHILHHHFVRAKAMQLRSGRRANRLRELHAALNVRREGALW